jgi:hypothetical protein
MSSQLWQKAENRRITVQANLGKKQDPILKRSGGMVEMVEHLPSKCKALISNPSTTK